MAYYINQAIHEQPTNTNHSFSNQELEFIELLEKSVRLSRKQDSISSDSDSSTSSTSSDSGMSAGQSSWSEYSSGYEMVSPPIVESKITEPYEGKPPPEYPIQWDQTFGNWNEVQQAPQTEILYSGNYLSQSLSSSVAKPVPVRYSEFSEPNVYSSATTFAGQIGHYYDNCENISDNSVYPITDNVYDSSAAISVNQSSPVYENLEQTNYISNSNPAPFTPPAHTSPSLALTTTTPQYNPAASQDYFYQANSYTDQYSSQYSSTVPATVTNYQYNINVIDQIPPVIVDQPQEVQYNLDLTQTSNQSIEENEASPAQSIPSRNESPDCNNVVTSGGKNSSKPKRHRTCYSVNQLRFLQERFAENPYLQRQLRTQYAKTLYLCERQIKIWYQNQRMKQKNKIKNTQMGDNVPLVAPRRPGRPKKQESEKVVKTEADSHREDVGRLMRIDEPIKEEANWSMPQLPYYQYHLDQNQ